MTVRKNILPNLFLHVLLLLTSLYMLIQNIAQPGAVQLLFIASLCTMGWYAARHVPFPSLFHWFMLAYVALFYFYPVLLPALDISFKASDRVVAGYCFMAAGGVHLFVITYELMRKTKSLKDPSQQDAFRINETKLRLAVFGLVGVNVMGALLMIVDAGSISMSTVMDIMTTSRADRKIESGALSLLGAYCLIAGGLAFVLLPVYARKSLSQTLMLAALLLVLDAFIMIAFRARTHLILHLIAVSVGFMYLRHRVVLVRSQGRKENKSGLTDINSRRILVRMAVFIFLIGVFGMYMRLVRGHIGTAKDLSILKQDLSTAVEFALAFDSAVGGDLGYTPTVFKVIDFVPQDYDYLKGQSYYRIFFTGVPRFVWSDKPDNTGIIVGRWIFPGTIVQSNPPGVMGDLYINFGFLGILGFIAFGIIFAKIDNSSRLAYYILVATSFGLTFHLARGAFTNPVLQFCILYLAALLLERFLLVRNPNTSKG